MLRLLREYIIKVVYDRRKVQSSANIIGMLEANKVIYSLNKNPPALALALSPVGGWWLLLLLSFE